MVVAMHEQRPLCYTRKSAVISQFKIIITLIDVQFFIMISEICLYREIVGEEKGCRLCSITVLFCCDFVKNASLYILTNDDSKYIAGHLCS